MKKALFSDGYYQVKIVIPTSSGTAELKTVHVLANDVTQAVSKARYISLCQIENIEKFLLRYRILKDVLMKEYHQMQGWQVSCCFIEACLRVIAMDCRTDNTLILLRRTANRVISNYVRNRNQ